MLIISSDICNTKKQEKDKIINDRVLGKLKKKKKETSGQTRLSFYLILNASSTQTNDGAVAKQ